MPVSPSTKGGRNTSGKTTSGAISAYYPGPSIMNEQETNGSLPSSPLRVGMLRWRWRAHPRASWPIFWEFFHTGTTMAGKMLSGRIVAGDFTRAFVGLSSRVSSARSSFKGGKPPEKCIVRDGRPR